MLKSNSKQVKEKIQVWLVELAINGLKERGGISEAELKTPITTADKIFQQEKDWEIDHYGRQQAFKDWQTGLCSTLPAYRSVLYGEAIKEKIKDWLEETEAEASKYDEDKLEDFFLWLIYREFEALLKKERKQDNK